MKSKINVSVLAYMEIGHLEIKKIIFAKNYANYKNI